MTRGHYTKNRNWYVFDQVFSVSLLLLCVNNQLLTCPNNYKYQIWSLGNIHVRQTYRPEFLACLTPSSFSAITRRPTEDLMVYTKPCWDQLPPCKQVRDQIILMVTCPDAGLPFKHSSSVYAIPSAFFPGQNVSFVGNCINSHEFTGNAILLKKDRVSLASHQDPTCTPSISVFYDLTSIVRGFL